MESIDYENVVCKNEADYIWEEETNIIETTGKTDKMKEMESIDYENDIECKNEADHIWEEETNITSYHNNAVNEKSDVDDKPVDYNVDEEAILKGSVANVNNIKIPVENVKNDSYIAITDKTVKNLSDIEILYNLPGDYEDELHAKIPEGSPLCERSALRFASQEAFDDLKKWSAEHAGERTTKITPRLPEPMVVNGIQFAKSPRVELRKYYAPPGYPPLFGAPLKKPKADSLKVKNSSKTSNEAVYSDANIAELSKRTKHLEEAKEKANCTEMVVGDKNNSLIESCKDKFICDECGQQFNKKDYIILHMKTEHVKDIDILFKKYVYSSVTKDRLEKHSKLNYCEIRKYFCDECNNRFISKNILKQHKQRCGIKNNVSNTHSALESYSCTKYGNKFSSKHSSIKHMRTHTGEKPYSCTLCNKRFSKSCNLNAHMRTHTGERPYSCTVCNKQFSESGSLNTHMRTHTGEKPYSCTVCKKQFSQNNNFNIHMRTHTGERPYSCTVCKKQFSERSKLNNHMRTHTGEKPYSCTVCKKQFSEHTGEKPYSCTVCKKQFRASSHLNTHMRTHTGEKPYSCSVCKKRFSNNFSLQRHSKKCK